MDRFEQGEIKKKRPIKGTFPVGLINIVLEIIRKTLGDFIDKVLSLFKIETSANDDKQIVYGHGKKLSKL